MLEQFKRMASSAFDILLDTYDIREQAVDTQVRFEQKLYGLWLAFRRGALNLTLEQVAYRAELDPYLLTLLETGLAAEKLTTQDIVQAYRWRQLALVLENETRDFDRVMDIINAGLGMPPPDSARMLKQVCDELATPIQRLEELEQREDVPKLVADMAPSVRQAPSDEFGLRPELEQTLVALANGASTGLDIQKEITARTQGQLSPGLATIHRILQALDKDFFIEITGKTAYGENIYALTADGAESAQMAVRVVRDRVELAEKEERLMEVKRQLHARFQSFSFAD